MPALRIQSSSGPTKVDLVDRPVVIGRSVDCDVQITEERASRKHFVVEPTDRGWVLRDCDSS
ncbi:MAG: FHA domain-containing protein, partial [Planctomycetota bacterium]